MKRNHIIIPNPNVLSRDKKTNKHRCSLTLFILTFSFSYDKLISNFSNIFIFLHLADMKFRGNRSLVSLINFEPSFIDKSPVHFSIRLVEIITNKAMNHNKSTHIGSLKRFVAHSYENVKKNDHQMR